MLASSVLFPLSVVTLEMLTTQCDDDSNSSDDALAISNPLWPSGVSVDMVNSYVEEFLADPNINIKSVPDSVERIIYTSTVRLTLNTVYEVASWFHGTEVLGHRLVLSRTNSVPPEDKLDLEINTGSNKLNVDILEAMADELLQNKVINQRWLPDIIEKQIYVNCLRIVFTIIDRISETMAFHICGHHLHLSFEPVNEDRARELVKRHTSSTIEIDEKALDVYIDEMVQESHDASPTTGIMSYLPGYMIFLKTLHKTLYSLILAILDDILSKTELLVLEDSIRIQLVPERVYAAQVLTNETESEKLKSMEKELGEVKSREARTRSTAGVLVVGPWLLPSWPSC